MSTPKKRLPGQQRREQLLRCAVKVFAQGNYRASRMSDIAREAGVSEAMIYKHFPSKKAIFLEVLERMSKSILAFWQEELDREADALKALQNMVLAYYRRVRTHPDDLKVHFQAISEIGDRDILARLRTDQRSYLSFVRKVIQRGIEQGHISDAVDVEAMTFLYTGGGVIVNLMTLLAFERQFNEALLVKMSRHLLDALRVERPCEEEPP